jgi:putative ABC transport system ATP-binding protein
MPVEAARCIDVVQVYDSDAGPVPALRGVDVVLEVGSITVITGPSGAGKSTLLRLLAGLEPPTAGEVLINGQATAKLRSRARRGFVAHHVGYVFQRPHENLLEDLTVRQHLALATRLCGHHRSASSLDRRRDESGVDDLPDVRPAALSAGQQQRLAFAMARIGRPTIVVADEPSAELDGAEAEALALSMRTAADRGATFAVATHDPVLMAVADQRLVVRRGLAASYSTRREHDIALIDDVGRLQLPDTVRDLFPSGRARLSIDTEGMRLDPL